LYIVEICYITITSLGGIAPRAKTSNAHGAAQFHFLNAVPAHDIAVIIFTKILKLLSHPPGSLQNTLKDICLICFQCLLRCPQSCLE
jgi:hypothetical protein